MPVDRTRAVLIIVVVAALGGLAGWLWTRSSSSPSAVTTTIAGGVTTSSSSSPANRSSSTTAPARAAGDTGSGLFFFQSPSGNITCLIEESGARCDISAHTFASPPKPAECDLDWGESVQVSANGAGFICHGDTARENGESVLPYGGVVERGDIRCLSLETGVSCTHRPSGHMFRLAREAFDLS